MTVGEKIRLYRVLRGYKQEELGKMVGLNGDRIQKYENSTRTPKVALLTKLADALDVDVGALSRIEINSEEDIMHILFELEDRYDIAIKKDDRAVAIVFENNNSVINDCLDFWYMNRQALYDADLSDNKEPQTKEYKLWRGRFGSNFLKGRKVNIMGKSFSVNSNGSFIDTLAKNSSRSKSAFVNDMLSIPFMLTDETRKMLKKEIEHHIIQNEILIATSDDRSREIEVYDDESYYDPKSTEIEGLEQLYCLVNKGIWYDSFYNHVIDDRTLCYRKGLCYLVNETDASSCVDAYVISFRSNKIPVFVFFDTEDFRKLTDDKSRMEYIMSVFEKNMVFNQLTIPNIIDLANYVKENKPVYQNCVHKLPAPGNYKSVEDFPFYDYAHYK